MNKLHKKDATKETKKSPQLTEKKVGEIAGEEIIKWIKEALIQDQSINKVCL